MTRRIPNFTELTGILCCGDARHILELEPVLTDAIEELGPMVGFSQHSPHHAYDLYTHTAYVTGGTGRDACLRWAALLHDIGKVDTFTQDENGRGHFRGHAQASAGKADIVLRRLGAPDDLRRTVVTLIENHMLPLEKEGVLEAQLERMGKKTLALLIDLQEADHAGKGTAESQNVEQFSRIRDHFTLLHTQRYLQEEPR